MVRTETSGITNNPEIEKAYRNLVHIKGEHYSQLSVMTSVIITNRRKKRRKKHLERNTRGLAFSGSLSSLNLLSMLGVPWPGSS